MEHWSLQLVCSTSTQCIYLSLAETTGVGVCCSCRVLLNKNKTKNITNILEPRPRPGRVPVRGLLKRTQRNHSDGIASNTELPKKKTDSYLYCERQIPTHRTKGTIEGQIVIICMHSVVYPQFAFSRPTHPPSFPDTRTCTSGPSDYPSRTSQCPQIVICVSFSCRYIPLLGHDGVKMCMV